MPTEAEIRDNYKDQHDVLTKSYYEGTSGLSKAQFDQQHAQVWADMETELLAGGYLVAPAPPRSSHISTLEAVDPTKARPARVKRVWNSKNYYYDCFATQTVRDEFIAAKIVIGDYVIVHFDDVGEQIVMAKVFKSW